MKETTLCYLEQNNAYLMLHRIKKKDDANQGKWIGLGGKVEKGESVEQCLVREVEEECGLRLQEYCYRGVVCFYSDLYDDEKMHLYTATSWTGQEQPCAEGELSWVDKSCLHQLPMWQGDSVFLNLLAQDVPFFELDLHYCGDCLELVMLDGKEENFTKDWNKRKSGVV